MSEWIPPPLWVALLSLVLSDTWGEHIRGENRIECLRDRGCQPWTMNVAFSFHYEAFLGKYYDSGAFIFAIKWQGDSEERGSIKKKIGKKVVQQTSLLVER